MYDEIDITAEDRLGVVRARLADMRNSLKDMSRNARRGSHRRKLGLLLSTARREYVVAYQADNGNVCLLRTPNTPTVVREYAEKDAVAMRSPEDQTEVFVAYRDTPVWQRATLPTD